jgi:DNA replication protein DnaC
MDWNRCPISSESALNNDSTITSAVLDRVLHHAETVILEGKSYRTKDQIADE